MEYALAEEQTNAVVTGRIELSPELFILQVTPDGWDLPGFEPGQFAVLGLPGSAHRTTFSDEEEEPPDPDKLIRRAYSIASSSKAREYMEFYVATVRSGALTPRLEALTIGDRIWLGQKVTGMFTLAQVPQEFHVVLVATGTGLAPYVSMLRTHLTTTTTERQFAVLHGARHSWDLGYRSELETMEQLRSNFNYVCSISRPHLEHVPWGGKAGYVQDLWTGGDLQKAWGRQADPKDTHVFLCGNPQMCEAMVELLNSEGFVEHTRKAPGQIHVERYW